MVRKRSAWNKNQLREIRHTMGRYIAILVIVALGVGFFAGLKVTKSAMVQTGNTYISSRNMYDYRLITTLGLTGDDAAYFSSMNGIKNAAGAISADFIAAGADGMEYNLRALSIGAANAPSLTNGRMPARPDECLLDRRYFSDEYMGETIRVAASNDEETKDKFVYGSYTVTGFADSVLYMNMSRGTTSLPGGLIKGFVYIPEGGFKLDYFTDIYIELKDGGQIFSDEYESAVSAMEQPLTDALELRADIRYKDIVNDANEEVAKAEDEYNSSYADYETQKADAQTQLDDAWQQLCDAKDLIDKNERKLKQSERQLDEAESEYKNSLAGYNAAFAAYEQTKSAALAQFAAAQQEIDTQRADAAAAMAGIESSAEFGDYIALLNTRDALEELLALEDPASPEYITLSQQLADTNAAIAAAESTVIIVQYLTLQATVVQLDAAQADLDAQVAAAFTQFAAAESQFADTKAQLDAAAQQINSGMHTIAAGKRKLADAKQEYEDGLAEYEDKKDEADKKIADAEKELADGKQKIEDAKDDIAAIEKPKCYVLDRTTNNGYVSFGNDSTIVEGISSVFPVFFFLVAALVCTTTMTRMVEEQRTQIGTLKALGYSNAAIMMKYISYSGSAAVAGCVLGFMLGSKLFPMAIWEAYSILYGFSDIEFVLDPVYAALALFVSLLCSAGATYLACRAELSEMPAELMRPKAPKPGKRVFLESVPFIWNRLNFLRKVSVRNILRYKKRFIMMVLGISGCTAMVLAGFGIKDSISSIAAKQFDDIMVFDIEATFDKAQTRQDMSRFISDTSGLLSDCVFITSDTFDVPCESGDKTAVIIATDDSDITKMIDLHYDGDPIPYPSFGNVVLSDKLAKFTGCAVGGNITIKLNDTDTRSFIVSGICENYVYNYIYMTAQTYESVLGEKCAFQNALAISAADDVHTVSAKLLSDFGVSAVSVNADTRDSVTNMIQSLNAVVALVIACAGALAFVVLFNLSNINITERVREIATIKVLGFYPNEVNTYVFRENNVLTALGAAAGLPLGILLHSFIMSQLKIDFVNFRAIILPLSFVYAPALTFVFTLAVDLFLRRKLDRINMAESLKSVE